MTDPAATPAALLPPSPFLPDTTLQYAWDSTSISTLLECPRRYELAIIQGWTPKGPGTAIPLVFGVLFHYGVEMWHRAKAEGSDHAAAEQLAIKAVMVKEEHGANLYEQLPTEESFQEEKAAHDEDEDDGGSLRNARVRTRYHLIRALTWYFEHFKHDTVETLILYNGKPAVELSFCVPVGVEVGDQQMLLSGHIDRVARFNDQLFVTDLKTTKSITRQWAQSFDLSHQMTGYTLGGSIALNEPVAGAMIDGVALQVGGVKFSRFFTYRQPSQLAEYMRMLRHVASLAEQYAEQSYYPMNTAACIFCKFKDVCRQPPEHRNRVLNYLYERKPAWNPLKSR